MNLHLHIKKHKLYYLSLIATQIAGYFLIIYFNPHKNLQISMAVLTSFFYAIIGLTHHKMDHTLSTKIVLEYVLVPALGIGLMFFYL